MERVFFCGDHRLPEIHKCENLPHRTWSTYVSDIQECYSCHRKEPHIVLYACRHCKSKFCTQHVPQESHNCKAPRIGMSLSSPSSEVIPFLRSRTEETVCFACGEASDGSLLLCPYCHHSFCSSHRWDMKRHRCKGSRESLSDLKKGMDFDSFVRLTGTKEGVSPYQTTLNKKIKC